MKRRIAILFLFVYLTPTVGVTVSWSRCNDRNMKVDKIEKCICKPGNPNKKCCDSKKYTFKFKDSQQKADILAQKFSNPVVDIVLPTSVLSFPDFYPAIKQQDFKLPRPPNRTTADIYLINRVLRI